MTDAPVAWSAQQSADIADLWHTLLAAAEEGNERAKDFLWTFRHWAKGQLDLVAKS